MQRVLIADDEHKVGLLIKRLIEWEPLELECVGLVRDGETAYERIVEEKPDIVITDIRMPGMSGLELIEKVTGMGLRPHFIVISGYKYFEYAQQAIKYGVEDYLLKPVDETELNEILRKICETERVRQRERGRLDEAEKKLNDSKYVLHREFLNSIVSMEDADLEEANKNYGLSFGQGLFQAFEIKVDRDISRERNEKQLKLILKKLEKLVEQEFEGLVRDTVAAVRKNGAVMTVLNYDAPEKREVEAALDRVFRKCSEYIEGFEHYEMTMGVSGVQTEFGKLSLALETAREAADFRILRGTGVRIDGGAIPRDLTVCAETIAETVKEKLCAAVEIARIEDIRCQVSRAFSLARENRAFGSEYYDLGKRLLALYLEQSGSQDREEKLECWGEAVGNCRSRLELEQFVAGTMVRDLEETLKATREREKRPVLEAVEYIRGHYGERLSLEEIAGRSGFNTNYFCELFKKETGKTFTVYLMEVRMEEAKRLLRDTGEPVYGIAEKVGYKDAKFFSQQFTKIVGIKPAEYRKLYY